MKKLVVKPIAPTFSSHPGERVTVQLRDYNEHGRYWRRPDGTGNETIHFVNCTLDQAYEIIKASLLNSRLVDPKIIVEDE